MKSAQTKRKNYYVVLDVVYWQLTVTMVIPMRYRSIIYMMKIRIRLFSMEPKQAIRWIV